MNDQMLQWHPIFGTAIQLNTAEEAETITFQTELGLNKMPMRIDLVLIKKDKEPLKKDFGRILRGHNIFEYKSPGDTLNIDDFYKTYAYACFYKANTEHVDEISAQDITISFVCNQYPKEMSKKLKKERNITIGQVSSGIYYLRGDPIPMQLILIPQLPYKENLWLSSLRTDLVPGEHLDMLMEDYQKHKHSKDYQAMMDVIVRANHNTFEEVKDMCEALHELFAEDVQKEVAKFTNLIALDVIEQVTEDVTEEVTEQVTKQVTEQVTKQVTQDVMRQDILLFVQALTDDGYTDEVIASRLRKYFSLTEEDIRYYLQAEQL